MAIMHVTINDERGQPLNGVILTNGEYNTTPCPTLNWGCTSGPGNQIGATTDANGNAQFSIPYTCEGEWSGTWTAAGYDDLPWDQKTGPITGDVHYTYQMVENQTTNGSAPQNSGANAGAGNAANQAAAAVAALENAGGHTGADLLGWITKYWWIFIVAAVVIAIILLALHYRSPGTVNQSMTGGGDVRASAIGV